MAVTGDPLRVGITGLLTSQTALGIVSHNVSNINTDGYTRQRTDIVNNAPTYSGAGYLGTGVNVVNIRRIADDYVNQQLVTHTTTKNYLQTTYDYASELDTILADADAGLNPALQQFFDSNHRVSSDPVSLPAREVMLTQARTLAQRFQILDQRMDDLRGNINLEIRDTITEINNLARQIADLNRDISTAPGRVSGILPNDLLDRREFLIKELGQYVKVQTIEQSNGSVNVYVGNGQTMVNDFNSFQMAVLPNKYDSSELGIGYVSGPNTVDISTLISGGKLAGLLEFRDDVLTPNQNALGRIAMSLEDTYNAQHRLGMDLNSELGLDFFDYSVEQPLPDVNNTVGAPTVTMTITDPNLLTTSNYVLRANGGGTYDLYRESDNSIIVAGAVPGTGIPIPTPDGFEIDITAGVVVQGDSYLIRPTRDGARTFENLIDDPSMIAAASPIIVDANLSNIGTGEIQLASVTATDDDPATAAAEGQGFVSARGGTLTLDPPVRVVFDPLVPDQFTLINDSTLAPIGGPYVYTPGIDIAPLVEAALLAPGDTLGYSVILTGQPGLNDTFSINYNTQGTSANANMLELAKLQTSKTMINGDTNYQDAYGQMVSTVGSQTHQVDIANNAQEVLLRQAEGRRESISGVNLDEEASNMLRFQQAYQAAAQVISTANNMFQTLIQSVR